MLVFRSVRFFSSLVSFHDQSAANKQEKFDQIRSRFSNSASTDPNAPHRPIDLTPAPISDLSFRTGVPPHQRAILNLVTGAIGIATLLQPVLSAIVLSSALFLVFSLLVTWRLFLVLVGVFARCLGHADKIDVPDVTGLPVFTILIAAYHEAALMDQLAKALHGLNWPDENTQILLLLESHDEATIEAAQRANFPISTTILQVPPGGPRTKPNALNFGLRRARGDYVGIFDVEDAPHPDQLLAAFNAFDHAPAEVVCVQAPLRADNGDASWIAAQWALDYDVQFSLLIPGLSVYRMPILLGGTSNYIRRDALLALGAWDAWNVTEDADLGMRLARANLRTASIATPTFETAPGTLPVWLAQRTRWLKGFLQTWLVLMRQPGQTLRQMGLVPFLVMQLTLGGALIAPLANAPSVLLAAIAFFSGQMAIGAFGLALLIAGLSVCFIGDILAPGRWSAQRMTAILTRPFYWPLHSLAAYRAVSELAIRPFFWAKTPHHPRDVEKVSFYSTGSSA